MVMLVVVLVIVLVAVLVARLVVVLVAPLVGMSTCCLGAGLVLRHPLRPVASMSCAPMSAN